MRILDSMTIMVHMYNLIPSCTICKHEKRFPGMFLTKEDAITTIYMNDIRLKSLGKRPLAKLTIYI